MKIDFMCQWIKDDLTVGGYINDKHKEVHFLANFFCFGLFTWLKYWRSWFTLKLHSRNTAILRHYFRAKQRLNRGYVKTCGNSAYYNRMLLDLENATSFNPSDLGRRTYNNVLPLVVCILIALFVSCKPTHSSQNTPFIVCFNWTICVRFYFLPGSWLIQGDQKNQ